jgi:hypothetical protein
MPRLLTMTRIAAAPDPRTALGLMAISAAGSLTAISLLIAGDAMMALGVFAGTVLLLFGLLLA